MSNSEPPSTAIRMTFVGPGVAHGAFPVNDMNAATGGLQTALQQIARQSWMLRGQSPPVSLSAVNRACELAIASMHLGSLVLELVFEQQEVEPGLLDLREEAVADLLLGFREFSYEEVLLPVGWTPGAVRAIRRLAGLITRRQLESIQIVAPHDDRLHATLTHETIRGLAELDVRHRATPSRGEPGLLLAVPKRRKNPKLPLFSSGRPELVDELDQSFGAKETPD